MMAAAAARVLGGQSVGGSDDDNDDDDRRSWRLDISWPLIAIDLADAQIGRRAIAIARATIAQCFHNAVCVACGEAWPQARPGS